MKLNLNDVFLNDLDGGFALEIVIRTLIMFALILLFLRLTGKKGIRQLSIFEVAIIIGLGSAAGDPMVNKDNAILPALIVFVTILLFYRLITWLAAKSERFENFLEGQPVYVIEEGQFVLLGNDEQTYAKDEFFAEMRQQSVEHVGQVRTALLETNGKVSFYFYDDDDVKPGLPILPKAYNNRTKRITKAGLYACTTCGSVRNLGTGTQECPRCHEAEWVVPIQTIRRT